MPHPPTLIPLGTASAIPAYGRHLSAAALVLADRWLLFDCGEGTQFRIREAGLRLSRLAAICITHLHGDHFYGLPGLLSTMGLVYERADRLDAPLQIISPKGLREFLTHVPGAHPEALPFPVELVEIEEGFEEATVLDHDCYTIEARPLDHRVFTVGYRFQARPRPGNLDVEKARALGLTDWHAYRALKAGEAVTAPDGRVVQPEEVVSPPTPGASFAYVFDTMPCPGARHLAEGVDLLYHEATFGDAMPGRAAETGHSTPRQAAELAREAGVGRLLLGHFSARYEDAALLADEARPVFQNTEAAVELNRYALRNGES